MEGSHFKVEKGFFSDLMYPVEEQNEKEDEGVTSRGNKVTHLRGEGFKSYGNGFIAFFARLFGVGVQVNYNGQDMTVNEKSFGKWIFRKALEENKEEGKDFIVKNATGEKNTIDVYQWIQRKSGEGADIENVNIMESAYVKMKELKKANFEEESDDDVVSDALKNARSAIHQALEQLKSKTAEDVRLAKLKILNEQPKSETPSGWMNSENTAVSDGVNKVIDGEDAKTAINQASPDINDVIFVIKNKIKDVLINNYQGPTTKR